MGADGVVERRDLMSGTARRSVRTSSATPRSGALRSRSDSTAPQSHNSKPESIAGDRLVERTEGAVRRADLQVALVRGRPAAARSPLSILGPQRPLQDLYFRSPSPPPDERCRRGSARRCARTPRPANGYEVRLGRRRCRRCAGGGVGDLLSVDMCGTGDLPSPAARASRWRRYAGGAPTAPRSRRGRERRPATRDALLQADRLRQRQRLAGLGDRDPQRVAPLLESPSSGVITTLIFFLA